jgi:Ca-activated chloride channel family protein
MALENRWVLSLLVVLPVVAWWFYRREGARRRDVALLGGAFGDNGMAAAWSFRRDALTLLALALVVLAAGAPRRDSYEKTSRANRDIVVLVDTSLSMAAEDIRPSRMRFAGEMIRALLSQLDGERIALTAVAGRGIVQCPLTRDYAAAAMLAESLTTDVIPQPGTALSDGFLKALGAFSRDESRARLLLVLSDGEDFGPNLARVAGQLRRNHVRAFIVGVGTEEGVPIPLRGADGALTGYKRDRTGTVVTTRLDAKRLRRVAEEAGGEFFRASPDGHVIQPVLDAMTRETGTGEARRFHGLQFALGLGALCALLAIP